VSITTPNSFAPPFLPLSANQTSALDVPHAAGDRELEGRSRWFCTVLTTLQSQPTPESDR
jgi:hypothetical protein